MGQTRFVNVGRDGFYGLLRRCFEQALDKPFLLMPNGETVTYREIDALSERAAGWLASQRVTAGDRVMAQLPKSVDAVAAYLGALRLGAVYVPLNTAYTAAELDYFTGDAAPVALLHDAHELAEALAEPQPPAPWSQIRPQSLAALVYTSGTTGRPKGAMLTHGNLAHNALTLRSAWRFSADDVLLHVLPIFHVHGLMVALHTAMVSTSAVIFHPKFTPEATVESLPDATVMMGVPTHYARLLGCVGFDSEVCRRIRLLVSGSAPMTAALHRAVDERTGHKVLERYGMSETLMITSNPYDGRRMAGTVGFALPGTQVRIDKGTGDVDESADNESAGDVGVVQVRGPGVGPGYWHRLSATRESRTADGWFITGDVGRVDDEGRLTLEGRLSDMIITGGYNVYPSEIEQALDAHPAVAESAVVGVEHPDLGEAVTAFVVLANPDAAAPTKERAGMAAASTGEAAELASALVDLALFKHPRHYVTIPRLPRNAMGKILKARLRELATGLLNYPTHRAGPALDSPKTGRPRIGTGRPGLTTVPL